MRSGGHPADSSGQSRRVPCPATRASRFVSPCWRVGDPGFASRVEQLRLGERTRARTSEGLSRRVPRGDQCQPVGARALFAHDNEHGQSTPWRGSQASARSTVVDRSNRQTSAHPPHARAGPTTNSRRPWAHSARRPRQPHHGPDTDLHSPLATSAPSPPRTRHRPPHTHPTSATDASTGFKPVRPDASHRNPAMQGTPRH